MEKLFRNTSTLAAIVAKIENFEDTFKVKGLENMSCSFKRNEQKEVIVDIEASFDVDKVLVNIREDLILYGEDKFLPYGDKKFSFILEQMKEIRKTFDYMIESFTTSFSLEGEKLVMKITCSLNVSKFKRKGKEVLSSKRKKSTSLDYEKISKDVEKSCEKIRKETSEHLKRFSEERKKDLNSEYKAFSEDLLNKLFGDNGDLK